MNRPTTVLSLGEMQRLNAPSGRLRRPLWRLGALIAGCVLLPFALPAQLPTPTYGWNLGNTLEPPGGEGTWGPAATQNLINAVADGGFNTIRLPVAWDSHANQSTLEIDPAWMARVKQVVDWCYERNLHVLLNIHWDNGWLENNITDTVDPTIDAKMRSYWTQIATTFAEYDHRLLFAGANEPDCDTAAEWATLRSYYNTFISAVRATGGYNADRWLVVQGPKTNYELSDQLITSMPEDSTPGRLALEVHHYTPYPFTIMSADEWWGKMSYFWGKDYHHPTRIDRNATFDEEDAVEAMFQLMADRFISQGIPVILGEFHAMKRVGYPDLTGGDFDLHVASRNYFHRYLVEAANRHGIMPIYWDIAGLMFDWTTGAVTDPDNLRALTGREPPLDPTASRLANVSVRAKSGTDADALIVGFYVAGTGSKPILIRGIGPSLEPFGIGGFLPDPVLSLVGAAAAPIAENDDWGSDALAVTPVAARLGAFTLDETSRDAAVLATLPTGAFSARILDKTGRVGVTLAETYDADLWGTARLVNISARTWVGQGEDNLIAGFVVSGSNPKTVLIRAVGPGLVQFGVSGVLADPILQVFRSGEQEHLYQNDDWQTTSSSQLVASAADATGAFELAEGSKDAALLVKLLPGLYSAVVSGTNHQTGVALVEVYEVQ